MEEADSLVGRTLAGRYRIDAELGEGGMGAVYLATDLELRGRRVVLKFPHAEHLEDPTFRLRFRDEIGSLAHLDHPHILKIHDAGEHEGLPFAVVQYAGGGDLRDRIEGAHQSPADVLEWLPDIADALDFVSRSGFCHRDVKPANIFFDEAGHAILSDFGIATVLDEATPESDLTLGNRTAIGMFVGSAKYCPPEALRRDLSPAYDQYSLAVTVYQALTGAVPVEGETSMDILFAKNNEPPRDVRTRAPELSEASAAAVMRALSRDRADRFPSCRAFADAFAAGVAAGAPVVSGGSGWLGRVPMLGAVAVGVALAVGAVSWLLAGRGARVSATTDRAPGRTVVSALHQVELGSTPGEFRDAIGLCRLTAPDCDASWLTSEDPIRTVLAPYALDRYEVSNREFRDFVERTGHVTDAERRGASYHQFVEVPGLSWRTPAPGVQAIDPARPVVHVSHADAEAFCAAAGMRLPTQDEWEFAARGDARRVFPWGDAWDPERAVWDLPAYDGVEAVDSRPAGEGPFGQLHLAGNVAEWTSTVAGGDRIIKGGAWSETNPARLRAAARVAESPDYTSSDLGFRCASEPAPDTGRAAAAAPQPPGTK